MHINNHYVGTGETQTVVLGFKPDYVEIFHPLIAFPYIRTRVGGNNLGYATIILTDNGFTVTPDLSEEGKVFSYMAMGR